MKLSKHLGVSEITPAILVEAGVVKITYGMVKILSNIEIKNTVKITAYKFSKTAQAAIEKDGKSVSIIKVRVSYEETEK